LGGLTKLPSISFSFRTTWSSFFRFILVCTSLWSTLQTIFENGSNIFTATNSRGLRHIAIGSYNNTLYARMANKEWNPVHLDHFPLSHPRCLDANAQGSTSSVRLSLYHTSPTEENKGTKIDLRIWQDNKAMQGVPLSLEEAIWLLIALERGFVEKPQTEEVMQGRNLHLLQKGGAREFVVLTQRDRLCYCVIPENRTLLINALRASIWILELLGQESSIMLQELITMATAVATVEFSKQTFKGSKKEHLKFLKEGLTGILPEPKIRENAWNYLMSIRTYFGLTEKEIEEKFNDFFHDVLMEKEEIKEYLEDAVLNPPYDESGDPTKFKLLKELAAMEKTRPKAIPKKRNKFGSKRTSEMALID
jgi:hypothetical protein